VKHFGQAGAHARALAGREYDRKAVANAHSVDLRALS
jgi:hypothetical protein